MADSVQFVLVLAFDMASCGSRWHMLEPGVIPSSLHTALKISDGEVFLLAVLQIDKTTLRIF